MKPGDLIWVEFAAITVGPTLKSATVSYTGPMIVLVIGEHYTPLTGKPCKNVKLISLLCSLGKVTSWSDLLGIARVRAKHESR